MGGPANNGSAITDYLIEWSLDGATWTRIADGTSSATASTVEGVDQRSDLFLPGRGSERDRHEPVERHRHGHPAGVPDAVSELTAVAAPAAGSAPDR